MATKRTKNTRNVTAPSDGDFTFKNPIHGGFYFNDKNIVEMTIDREQLAGLVRITDSLTNEEFVLQGTFEKVEV